MPHHPTIGRKEFCPKEMEKYSDSEGYTQTTTNYLESYKHTSYIQSNLEWVTLASVKKIILKEVKGMITLSS